MSGDAMLEVPDRPELTALIAEAATHAGALWSAHRDLG
jgi:hypothetical protein